MLPKNFVDKDGEIICALVTGYEAIELTVSDRATVLFDRFAVHMTRGDIEQELRLHGLDYLVRLLKVRDYRESIAKLPLRNRKPDWSMLRHRERYDAFESFADGRLRRVS